MIGEGQEPQEAHPPEAAEDLEEGEAVGLRQFAVLQEDGSVLERYQIGLFEFGIDVGDVCEIIILCEAEGRLVVAVPEAVWSRTVVKRILPPKSLVKPALVSVASCPRELLVEEIEESQEQTFSMKIWCGTLDPRYEEQLSFDGEADPVHSFVYRDRLASPLSVGLAEMAQEQFAFKSAESGAPEVLPDTPEARFERLERSVAAIQKNLENFIALRSPAPVLQPKSKQKAVASKKATNPGEIKGLDPSVVQSALAVGVPIQHLREMGNILKEKPKRLEEVPREAAAVKNTPLGEEIFVEEELELPDGEEEEGGADSGGSGMERAILELTRIASHLTESRKKDPLEALLDGSAASSSGAEGGGIPSAKKNAAALRALQKCLRERPKVIYEAIEANLQSDFLSRPTSPGEPLVGGTTARGWLTAKSRIMLYNNHVRWAWQTAGIWDCLMGGRAEEARARTALLVASADQSSIDGGSWLISTAALLESPPPYQMFATHQPPSHFEAQHSALFDPRWMEVFMAHVRELDNYQEVRKKLGKPPKKDEEEPGLIRKPGPKVKAKPDKGGKGKGKERAAVEDAGGS